MKPVWFRNPLVPVEVTQREVMLKNRIVRARLGPLPADGDQLAKRFGRQLGISLLFSMCLAVPVAQFAAGSAPWLVVLALCLVPVMWAVGTTMNMRAVRRDTADLRELRAASGFFAPAGDAAKHVGVIVDGIAGLPVHLRADFAPMLETVQECCATLEAVPGDPTYLGMLAERAAAVSRVRAESDALEAIHRSRDADDRFTGARDGDDLVIAAQIRDALAEVRSRVTPSALPGVPPRSEGAPVRGVDASGSDEADP